MRLLGARKQKSAKHKPLTVAEVEDLYKRPRSFTDWLPWVEYDAQSQCFRLEDGVSFGAMFEVNVVATEARPERFLAEVEQNLQSLMNHAVPELDVPYVLQVYVQDEASLQSTADAFEQYIPDEIRSTEYSQDYLKKYHAHLKNVAAPDGYFIDQTISGGSWAGKIRRVRCFLYRRIQGVELDYGCSAPQEINEVVDKFTSQAVAAGLSIRRCTGQDLYEWMLRWFNPKSIDTHGDADLLIQLAPYPGDNELPYGTDLAALMTLSQPVSCAKTGVWRFDDMPHKVITIDGLRRVPQVGHLTGERAMGDHLYAPFDRFPAGSILAFTVVFQPQDITQNHLSLMRAASKGETEDAKLAEQDANDALKKIAQGDKLYPVITTLFLRADTLTALRAKTNEANAMLLGQGLHPIREKDDQLSLHSYLKQLPMNYEPAKEKQSRRSRFMFSSHLARLLPFYGRSRGTGHPGLSFFNRAAEPLVFDPLNKEDRSKNAFGVLIGPPGSGKSALLVAMLEQLMAVHRPRLFIIEKGGSFKLLAEHFQRLGLSVHAIAAKATEDISLPPFADALTMLRQTGSNLQEAIAADVTEDSELEETEEDEARDYLGEMELAARVMITGGEAKEEAKMSRADRLVIRQAIVAAATHKQERMDQKRQKGERLSEVDQQVLTEDVVVELWAQSKDSSKPDQRRERIGELAASMELFCTGLAGRFFNRPGTMWPEADVTIFEMGLLANEGYEDQLTVAFMALMNRIHALVERDQTHARPTVVVTDEAHLITTNQLLAPYVVKIIKMWRKLGAWLWLATQNLEDFPNESKKMLNMFEWWIAMACPKEEIRQIARFKALTPEQETLLSAAHKEPQKYTEGVVMADKINALFRNVPIPQSLALAMTEKHEKAVRAQIMREQGCSELDAAYAMAMQIEVARREALS